MRFPIVSIGMMSTLLLQAADTKDQQQQRADAPVLGYAFGETTRELRAILGVPGSSRWSDAIPLPDGVTALRIANGHRWALASSAAGETSVLSLDTLQLKRLEGAGTFDGAIFSPSGSAAAIRRDATVTVFTGLPDAPVKAAEFASADLATVAISDQGDAASVREGRIVNAVTGEVLHECSDGCRIAYFPGASDLAVFESGRLTELRGRESRVIAEGLPLAEIEQFAAASHRVALASKEKLLVLDRASGAVAVEEPVAGSDRMEALRLPGSWLLSAAEDSAAWLYSNDGVRFVPAAARIAAVEGKEQ